MDRGEGKVTQDNGGAPGQPDSLSGGSPSDVPGRGNTAAKKLFGLISWLRGRLERLHDLVKSEYTRVTVHSLIRACDPATNPRLRAALDQLGLELEPPQLTWTFQRLPRSANRVLRAHWGARCRERDSWIEYVHSVSGRRPRPVDRKVRLEVTVHRRKLQDPDNANASVKPLLDALKRTGWLRDDSPRWLDLSVTEAVEKDRRRQRTEVRWSPVPGPQLETDDSRVSCPPLEATPEEPDKVVGTLKSRGGKSELAAPAFSPEPPKEEPA